MFLTAYAKLCVGGMEVWAGESGGVEEWSEQVEVEGWRSEQVEVEGWSGQMEAEGWRNEQVEVEGWMSEQVEVEGWMSEQVEVEGHLHCQENIPTCLSPGHKDIGTKSHVIASCAFL